MTMESLRATRHRHAMRLMLLATALLFAAGCQQPTADAKPSVAANPPPPMVLPATSQATDRVADHVAAAGAADAAGVAALNASFDPQRDPTADLHTAMAEAARSGRRIVLDVGGEWCSWCHRMDAFIADDTQVRALRDGNYVWMKVNYSEDNENAAFLGQYPQVKGYPHLFVLDADGTLLHSQFTGALEAGKSYDREKFVAFLGAWAPKKS